MSDKEDIPKNVKFVLEMAGDNRAELEKVINFYQKPEDSLKLRAAYYLIENMADLYHYEGEGILQYRKVFDIRDSLEVAGKIDYYKSWDSIQAIHSPPPLSSVKLVWDRDIIKADFLIENIEQAFKAWKYPWAKSLSFNQFCEFILPYKLKNEALENWREVVQERYKWVLDSVKNESNPRVVCKLINNNLKKYFYINARFRCNWDLTLTDLIKLKTGRCSDATQFTAYIMRAMGIPVAMDYTPLWASKNIGHDWNGLIEQDKTISFIGSETHPGEDKVEFTRSYWIRRKRAKVYRRSFELQLNSLAMLADSIDNVPSLFRNRHFKDVTSLYVPVSNIELTLLDNLPASTKYAYICVFNNQEWQPIHWGVVKSGNKVLFNDMGRDIVYLPMIYHKSTLVPAGPPFLLMKTGNIQLLSPALDKSESITILQKYPEDKSNKIQSDNNYELFYWNDKWLSLGQQKASSDSLVYNNIPVNALLRVHNMDGGVQERIFTVKDRKQVWW